MSVQFLLHQAHPACRRPVVFLLPRLQEQAFLSSCECVCSSISCLFCPGDTCSSSATFLPCLRCRLPTWMFWRFLLGKPPNRATELRAIVFSCLHLRAAL